MDSVCLLEDAEGVSTTRYSINPRASTMVRGSQVTMIVVVSAEERTACTLPGGLVGAAGRESEILM